ncbi:hypothetical protein AVEN_92141-1 [Araneus ventricosus]|uniref:RNase H type-1 domain-containing protein n=1 Tax=Araneus ventricosus TaxID=182803 RepID=A0A4Y2G8F2_ARAVE|nr:hypothetical protein AVEN_92141-1 [Araneus ventricosus]
MASGSHVCFPDLGDKLGYFGDEIWDLKGAGIFSKCKIKTVLKAYTDGSKINDQTGSAFCVIANEAITKTWKAKMSPANTVFQAEMLALKAAIEWANTANEDVNIWSDSESSLQDLKS